MINSLYIFITVIGLTSLCVVFYYNFLLKKILKVLIQLIELQSKKYENTQEYIEQIKLLLHKIDIKDITYDISYLTKNITHKTKSKEKYIFITKEIKDDLIDSGTISLVVQNNKGERRVLNRLILYVTSLQIINKIHLEIHTINQSFEKISKLQTYMMHDLKNVLQFFQAMQYNIENLKTQEEKSRFIEFLQNSTKPTNHKINKILTLLNVHTDIAQSNDNQEISIAQLFREYADYYKLKCKIDQDATVSINQEQLRTVIDNILGNIHDKDLMQENITATITIKKTKDEITLKISDTGSKFKNPNEVCTPFYTTKAEGIGIGMYQVANIVKSLNGKIVCKNHNEHPQIEIKIPTNAIMTTN